MASMRIRIWPTSVVIESLGFTSLACTSSSGHHAEIGTPPHPTPPHPTEAVGENCSEARKPLRNQRDEVGPLWHHPAG
jgi:hypothetical protein